ncbi:hypothetical protein [Prochlorothrix hollandica]|uniref:hypothetical protein n=1 Tax=Prochlorothrix hollandica TaxID=1223 RepID=UPI0012B62AAB|nr:hypothetical protein [Prochlorothrix hollandica]
MVAPVVGRQEGRPGGENPTRGRWFPGKMHLVDSALTGDRGAETLLTFPLNSFPLNSYRAPRLIGLGGFAARHNPYSCVGPGARIWIFRGALHLCKFGFPLKAGQD